MATWFTLSAIRHEHIRRANAYADRVIRRTLDPFGLCSALIAVGIYLVSEGYEDDACTGERDAGWNFHRYRLYAATLTEAQMAEELELARRTIALWQRQAPAFAVAA